MDLSTLRALQKRLGELEAQVIRPRLGVVASTSPLTVSVAGATPVPAQKIAGSSLATDDVVFVLTWSGSLIVIGGVE